MRMVSEYTEEDANGFSEAAAGPALTQWTPQTLARSRMTVWLLSNLGETRGRGRIDQHHEAQGRAVKRIYVYPLCRDVQHRLAQDSAPRWIPWQEA